MDDFNVNTDFITPVYPPQPLLPCFNGVWPPDGQYWPIAGGSDAVTLSAPFDCVWEAAPTEPWIHLTTTSGVGDAYLEYSVDENTGGERTGAIVINGWSFAVFQSGDNTSPPEPEVGGETLTLEEAPTVIASIAPDGTPSFARAAGVSVTTDVDGTPRFAVPKNLLTATPMGFLDPATGIHWRTRPQKELVADQCFGNCGAGCTATLLLGLPAPCGNPDYWDVRMAGGAATLVDTETREECIGREKFLNEYDVYLGTVRWTYHGIWTQACEDHDWVMRQNAFDGSIGVLPFIFGICGGPNERRTWNYETTAFGVKLRSASLQPDGALTCREP
jgi:hypothetical protein